MDKVLQKFDKQLHDVRVYTLGAFLWRLSRSRKVRDAYHLKLAYRLNLVCFDAIAGYSLSSLGSRFAKRHEDRFLAMQPQGRKKVQP